MLFIPYSSAFHFFKQPYVTYAVIIICIVLHQFQWENRRDIEREASDYCLSVKKQPPSDASFDFFKHNTSLCRVYLAWMHESPGRDVISHSLSQHLSERSQYSQEQIDQAIDNANKHYQVFKHKVPQSLDGAVKYYPDESNVFRMLTASFAHADWLHLIGNMLFFFAFAPGVEALINNKLKYAVVILTLVVICHLSYSAYSAGAAIAVPTLGLSGVVMGMMGVAAYLMPNARIKVFIWGFRYVRSYYMPAWILAAFYIGWDALNLYWFGNSGGVNLISHVSGGLAGFVIALLFFRKRRRETKKELAEEVDYHISRKNDFNSYDLSSTYGREQAQQRYQLKQSKREHEAFLQKMYTLVSVKKDSAAIQLLITDFERYRQDYQLLQQLFDTITSWGKSRTQLCAGRLLIDVLINASQYARAVAVIKACQHTAPDFVLADPGMTLLLVRYAVDMHETDVAYYLLHDAERRYHKSVDVTAMQIREAELCLIQLNKTEQARDIVKKLLAKTDSSYKSQILALAKLIT